MVGLHHHIRIFIINSHDGRRETHWNTSGVQLMVVVPERRWKVMMMKTPCGSYLTSECAVVNITILIRALSLQSLYHRNIVIIIRSRLNHSCHLSLLSNCSLIHIIRFWNIFELKYLVNPIQIARNVPELWPLVILVHLRIILSPARLFQKKNPFTCSMTKALALFTIFSSVSYYNNNALAKFS